MFFLYIRIFVIIKRHQAQRALQRQQSCQISIRARSGTIQSQQSTYKHDSLKYCTSQSSPLGNKRISFDNGGSVRNGLGSLRKKLDDSEAEDDDVATGKVDDKSIQHYSEMMVTTQTDQKLTKTTLYRNNSEINIEIQSKNKLNCLLIYLGFRSSPNRRLNSSLSDLNSSTECKEETKQFLPQVPTTRSEREVRDGANTKLTFRTKSMHMALEQTASGPCSTGHAKALVTTLLILGTYLLCWMPAVLFFALTCVDYCPLPLTSMNFRSRVIFSFIANSLVLLKAIVDPFIYTYRMKEMKTALNRYVKLPYFESNFN